MRMFDLSWRLFCMTGTIDSYLLMKRIEKERSNQWSIEKNQAEQNAKKKTV
ncbi:MAG: YqzL family protein [Sporolactobacillus sp.]